MNNIHRTSVSPWHWIVAVALTMLLAACVAPVGISQPTEANQPAEAAQSAVPSPIERIVIGTTMEVKGLDIDDYYFGIMRATTTHMALIKLNEQGEFAGDLAESWQTDDGRVWTFKLREGLQWHDGVEVQAADVKFSMEYLKEKLPVYQSHLKLLQTVEAPDTQTVVVTLSEPSARFPVNLLAVRILPKHIFENIEDPKKFNDPKAAIGCGPYIFESFDEASGLVTFKANPRFYRGAPNVKQVIFRLFKNPDSMYLALKKGEIDLTYFYAAGADPATADALAKEPNIKIIQMANGGVPNAIFFHTKKPPVNDVRFRKALSYAINYEELLKLFAFGYGSVPQAGFVPEGSAGFSATEKLRYAPDKAQELLDELGYKDADGDGVRDREGKALELELIVRSDLAENVRIAELLKKYFEAVGVGVKLKPVDATLFRTISDQEKSHTLFLSRTTTWGMMMWGGAGTGYFDARNIGWAMVDQPEFQALVDKLLNTTDPQKSRELMAQVQQFYAQELPAIPLYWNRLLQPYNARYEGWKVNPMYGVLWDESWYNLRQAGN